MGIKFSVYVQLINTDGATTSTSSCTKILSHSLNLIPTSISYLSSFKFLKNVSINQNNLSFLYSKCNDENVTRKISQNEAILYVDVINSGERIKLCLLRKYFNSEKGNSS